MTIFLFFIVVVFGGVGFVFIFKVLWCFSFLFAALAYSLFGDATEPNITANLPSGSFQRVYF